MSWWQTIKAAFQPRPAQPRVYMPSAQAGVRVTEDTALTYGAVWACISLISRTIAGLPWNVYEKTPNGRNQLGGGIDWLLNNQPNPEMTAFSFREALIAHVLTWGNGYAEIQKDMAGRVVALWLIAPDRVCVVRDEQTRDLRYRVYNPDGTESELTPAQVLHVHGLGFDGVTGYSPIRMAARAIGSGIAQDAFAQAFYANGTTFGGFVTVEGKMDEDDIETVENYINNKHRGPEKAFRVRVLAKGMEFKQIEMPLADAQFIESCNRSVTEIARWYGVPPHKIADLARSTNNNIEHQEIEFARDAIAPWVDRLAQEANVKLFAPRAQGRVYTKLVLNALMRGDATARANFYKTMVQMGAMSINEVRALEDMNGIGDEGDARLVQLNQTTLERMVEGPPDPAALGGQAPTPAEPATQEPAEAPDPKDVAEGADATQPDNIIRRDRLAWWRSQAGAEWRERNQA